MALRLAVLAILLASEPALANDYSPWFGSEATSATQIALTSKSENSSPNLQNTTDSVDASCPIEGCSAPSKPVKYDN